MVMAEEVWWWGGGGCHDGLHGRVSVGMTWCWGGSGELGGEAEEREVGVVELEVSFEREFDG